MRPKDRARRFDRLKTLQCVCCWMNGREVSVAGQQNPGQVEIHHLNLGGHAGMKRLGDEFTIPLCKWHHRGVVPWGWSPTQSRNLLGPSLSRSSKAFRVRYGTDEVLLKLTNQILETVA